MEMINELLLPPTAGQFGLISYLIPFMLLFFLPYLGIMIVSSLTSLALRNNHPRLAEYFHEPWSGLGQILTFAVIPLICLLFLFRLLFYGALIPVDSFLARLSIPLLGGFLLLFHNRRIKRNLISGLAGSFLLLTGGFFLISVLVLLFFPEEWPFVTTPLPLVFNIHVVIHFLAFIVLSVIITGAFHYFIYFKWPDTVLPDNHPDASQLRLLSLSMVLAGSILLPILLISDLAMLPSFSLSFAVFLVCIILLGVILILSLSSLSGIRSDTVRHATLLMVGATLLFALFLVRNQMLAAQSNLEQHALLSAEVQKVQQDWASERESKRTSSMAIDTMLGERIFTERCTACHQFSKKVVGPAYNDVLPKYVDDPAALETFIRNPVKVDANFPPMPNQGLNLREVKAVSAYLLEEFGKEKE